MPSGGQGARGDAVPRSRRARCAVGAPRGVSSLPARRGRAGPLRGGGRHGGAGAGAAGAARAAGGVWAAGRAAAAAAHAPRAATMARVAAVAVGDASALRERRAGAGPTARRGVRCARTSACGPVVGGRTEERRRPSRADPVAPRVGWHSSDGGDRYIACHALSAQRPTPPGGAPWDGRLRLADGDHRHTAA